MKKYKKAAKVDEISFNDSVKAGVEVKLNVKGYLGDPSWKLLPETIDLNEERKIISIKLFAEKKPDAIVIQVIKKFEKSIPLVFPVAGRWSILCNQVSLEFDVE